MSAPDRIWLDWPAANKGEPVFDEPPENEFQAGQVGYVRADIAADLLAALEAAVECGMVPTSTAKNGGAPSYALQAHVADQIRAAISRARGAS